MTSAYILIAAILLLGGLIAALGDRLGTKVGKARLRLFNLRPRQTAIVVTILTGTMIAASTLGILFALSDSLRQGVFELDQILKKRREVQGELDKVTKEKKQVEKELSEAKTEQAEVQRRLDRTNRNFEQAKAQLKAVSRQANILRSEIETLLSERQQLLQQRNQLKELLTQLQEQLRERERKIADQDKILQEKEIRLQQLEKEQSLLQAEITQRDNVIGQLDQAIAAKDGELQAREVRLEDLEKQLAFLNQEVEVLEQYYQNYQELRERRIAIVRGQVLAFAAFRIVEPTAVTQAIDQLLRQANRTAIQATRPGSEEFNERVVKITKAQVEQLLDQIQDGRDYVVRILSAGNYVQGEKEVRVFADIAFNQEIFNQGEMIATVSIDSDNITEADIQKRLDLLLAASQFRARRAGILGKIQIGDGHIKTLINFIEELNESEEPLEEIKAVAAETTYTAGPLKLRLVAIRDGKVIFST